MNLPFSVGFWSTQGNFTGVEEKVGEAEVATTALAMEDEACQEEIHQTLSVREHGDWADKGQDFQRWNSLPVTECMSVLNMPQLLLLMIWDGSSNPVGINTTP